MARATTYIASQEEPRTINRGRYALVGLATVVAAVAANALFYYLAGAIVTYHPEFLILESVITTIIFTTVPAVVAVLLYVALLHYAGNPARTFTIVAAVVFVISLIPDIIWIPSEPGASNGQTAILMVMHAIAAVVIVGMLTTLAPGQARQPGASDDHRSTT